MMRYYRGVVFFTLFIVVIGQQEVSGQQVQLTGKVLDALKRVPIEFAHVQNFSRNFSTFCDSHGFFTLEVNNGDTLVLSAIGYYYRKIIVNDTLVNLNNLKIFTLAQRAYEISEAKIYNLGTYEQFKQKFIQLDLPKTKAEMIRESIADLSHIEARKAFDNARAKDVMQNGVTLLTIPILSPEDKQRIKLQKVIQDEKIKNRIYEKFNPDIVKKVTGLTNDDEVIDFMLFCNFNDNYLLEVSLYDLQVRIAAKFEQFKMIKQKGRDTPMNTIVGNKQIWA